MFTLSFLHVSLDNSFISNHPLRCLPFFVTLPSSRTTRVTTPFTSLLPSYAQDSPIASHFECHQFIPILFLHCPRFACIQCYTEHLHVGYHKVLPGFYAEAFAFPDALKL